MSDIRDLVLNKITGFFIISGSKERGRLVVIITVGIIVIIVWYLLKKSQKKMALVDELYGRENLAPNLGWKDLKYPIIGFDGDLAEPIQVLSRDEFKRDYAGGIGVKYVIDAELKKHNVQDVKLGDIGGTDPRIAKIKFPKVEVSQERIDFGEMKIQMIKKIKRDKMSCYAGLEEDMGKAKDIKELAQVMNKGEY